MVWNCWPSEMCGGGGTIDEGDSRDFHCAAANSFVVMKDEREKEGNDIVLDEKSEKFHFVDGCVFAL